MHLGRPMEKTDDMRPLPSCVEVMAQAYHWDPFGHRWGRGSHWPLLASMGVGRYRSVQMRKKRALKKKAKEMAQWAGYRAALAASSWQSQSWSSTAWSSSAWGSQSWSSQPKSAAIGGRNRSSTLRWRSTGGHVREAALTEPAQKVSLLAPEESRTKTRTFEPAMWHWSLLRLQKHVENLIPMGLLLRLSEYTGVLF